MTDRDPVRDAAALRKDLTHLWHPYTDMSRYGEQQLVITRGRGALVYDADGREYIDAISGLWNVNAGHGRREIVDAVAAQMAELAFFPLNGASHLPAIELAAELAALAPPGLDKVFFCNSGAEGTETAIKIARAYWKRRGHADKIKIVSLDHGWHGATLGALSASHIDDERAPFGPLAPGFVKIASPNCYRCDLGLTYPSCRVACARALDELIGREGSGTIAALIAEPIQGLGGVIVPAAEYWPMIRRFCDERELLLIVDEVATGFGRTGSAFAIAQWGVTPDLLVASKGITSGYLPMSAVLTTSQVYDAFLAGGALPHGFTTGGHPAACAAALANIALLRADRLLERDRTGRDLVEAFAPLRTLDKVGDIRGRGYMVGIELVEDRTSRRPYPEPRRVCAELRRRGVLVRSIGNVIPFFPPLTIEPALVERAVGAYREVIESL